MTEESCFSEILIILYIQVLDDMSKLKESIISMMEYKTHVMNTIIYKRRVDIRTRAQVSKLSLISNALYSKAS